MCNRKHVNSEKKIVPKNVNLLFYHPVRVMEVHKNTLPLVREPST